jgi:hypothetical protein
MKKGDNVRVVRGKLKDAVLTLDRLVTGYIGRFWWCSRKVAKKKFDGTRMRTEYVDDWVLLSEGQLEILAN